jgi:hypothetical protein
MPRQTVIVFCTDPTECYEDLKLFCEMKELSYNTWSRKNLNEPTYYKGFLVKRLPIDRFEGHRYLDERLEIIKRER